MITVTGEATPGRRASLRYPGERLDQLLTRQAAQHGTKAAIVHPDAGSLDFATLDRDTGDWAHALQARLAVPPGSVIAVSATLDPSFAVVYLGAMRAGVVIAPVNPLLPGPVLADLLSGVGTRLAVLEDQVLRKLLPLLDRIPGLKLMSLRSTELPLPTLRDVVARERAAADDPAIAPLGTDLDQVASILFTSGTTGAPKAVQLTHRNLIVNATQIADAHRLDSESICVNHLPTYHPMHLNSALVAGSSQVLCPAPDPVTAVETAGRSGATHFYSLPVRLARLAADDRLGGLRAPTLQVVASGGSALAPAVAERLSAQFSVPVIQGYGLAETSPLTHSDPPGAPCPGSVGTTVADTECRVVDVDTRRPLPPGADGEVQVRGPQVMRGYLDGTGVAPDGWFDTGDLGHVDDGGRLFLVDRLKDTFKCDNWLVAPRTIESALLRQPAIAECCVLDVPHAFSGAVAHALVVRSGPDVSDAELGSAIAAVNQELPYYERVHRHVVVPAIPRTGNGKVSRAELRRTHFPEQSQPTEPEAQTMVTLVNKFTVHGDPQEFERVWKESSEFMRRQPGFVNFHLVRSLSDPSVYINIAKWADAKSHQQVMAGQEFRSHIGALAALAKPEPYLCHTVIEHDAA